MIDDATLEKIQKTLLAQGAVGAAAGHSLTAVLLCELIIETRNATRVLAFIEQKILQDYGGI